MEAGGKSTEKIGDFLLDISRLDVPHDGTMAHPPLVFHYLISDLADTYRQQQ